MSTHYRATFTSEPRNAALARRSIASFASVCGFSEREVADIRLAAGEAVSNAVEYGRNRHSGGFTVRCKFEDDCLTIEILDSGAGLRSPNVRVVGSDEQRRGIGIFLMRHLMDDVQFARDGTLVRLTRRHETTA
ncbi:MAG TPA: ATP-binding protein [Candidatus Acidoferrales bacterium]|nr:ATP-binding protein [Candidatus Acidoferrales bacterium]